MMMSVVIPSYNEEEMIVKTAGVISAILKDASISYEIIFVDDGSKDKTWEKVCEASRAYANVHGISFSRNFGKESAIFAGLEYAAGDCCAVIDCDLQHPPEVLVEMYRLWERGYDAVEGVKATRGKESILYKLSAKVFYSFISRATNIDMSRASDFKLLDRKVVDIFLKLPERKVFFRALSSWVGFKSVQIEFDVRSREAGRSKWSIISLIKYAVNNITSFSTMPLHVVTASGVLFFLFAAVFGVYSLVKFFMGNSLEGFTTIILLLLIIGSILMLSLGIIGYYLAKIYEEVKFRPRYIVAQTTDGNISASDNKREQKPQ